MSGQGPTALDGLTVLEFGLDEAGQYAGRLLAGLGARVVSIEPPGGVATRTLPPFVQDRAGRRRSVPHEYLNAGKESFAVAAGAEALATVLRRFEGTADVLLVGGAARRAVPGDLGYPVVTTSLYGTHGGRGDAPSTPLTRFQSGGSGSLMPSPRPITPGTLAGECFSGAGLALSVLGMLLTRMRNEDGGVPRVDHAEQAHLVNLEKMFMGRFSKDKADVTRQSHRYPFGGAVRCRDGFVSMLINERHQWRGFCEAIGKPEWATDERFATGSARFRMKDAIEAALHPWCAARTRREVVDAMRGRQVPIGSVNEVGELQGDAALRARGFVRDDETPCGTVPTLGLPYGADPIFARPGGGRAWAPLPGEQTDAILDALGVDADARAALSAPRLTGDDHVPA